MFYNKCIFESYDCQGKRTRIDYEVPFEYFYWPTVYSCEYHSKNKITYVDALNTQSNVITNNRKMTHTQELLQFQGLDWWIGNCEEIIFCDECKGVGGIEDKSSPLLLRPCEKCNSTGRKLT